MLFLLIFYWLIYTKVYCFFSYFFYNYSPYMKNTLIIVLVIALLVIWWVLYFYRDAIFWASKNTSDVASEAIEEIKEWFEDVKETMQK